MPNRPRFNLKDKKKEYTSILLKYRYRKNHLPLTYSFNTQIEPKNWDFSKMRPKRDRELTRLLDNIERVVKEAHHRAINEGIYLTDTYFRVILDEWLNRAEKTEEEKTITEITFSDYLKKWIALQKLSKKSIQNLKSYAKKLLAFAGQDVKLSELTLPFWLDFFDHLIHEFAPSSVRSYMIIYQKMATNAPEVGYQFAHIPNEQRFKLKNTLSDLPALTEEELIALYNAGKNYEEPLYHQRTTLAAWTGMAYIEALRFDPKKNIYEDNGNKFIKIFRKKTTKPSLIPVHPYIEEILENFISGVYYSNTTFNLHFRRIAKLAKIDRTYPVTVWKDGKPNVEMSVLHEVIGAHTLRRSFITNASRAGINDDSIMSMCAITYDTLQRYKKLTAEEKAIRATKTNFFTVKLKAI